MTSLSSFTIWTKHKTLESAAFTKLFSTSQWRYWAVRELASKASEACSKRSVTQLRSATDELREAIEFRGMMFQFYPAGTVKAANHRYFLKTLKSILERLKTACEGRTATQHRADARKLEEDVVQIIEGSVEDAQGLKIDPAAATGWSEESMDDNYRDGFLQIVCESNHRMRKIWHMAYKGEMDIFIASTVANVEARELLASIHAAILTYPRWFGDFQKLKDELEPMGLDLAVAESAVNFSTEATAAHLKGKRFYTKWVDDLNPKSWTLPFYAPTSTETGYSATANEARNDKDDVPKPILCAETFIYQLVVSGQEGFVSSKPAFVRELITSIKSLAVKRDESLIFISCVCAEMILHLAWRWHRPGLEKSKASALARIRYFEKVGGAIQPEKYQTFLKVTIKMIQGCRNIWSVGYFFSICQGWYQNIFNVGLRVPLIRAFVLVYENYRLLGNTTFEPLENFCVSFGKLLFWDGRPSSTQMCEESWKWVMPMIKKDYINNKKIACNRETQELPLLFRLQGSEYAITPEIKKAVLDGNKESNQTEFLMRLATELKQDAARYPDILKMTNAIKEAVKEVSERDYATDDHFSMHLGMFCLGKENQSRCEAVIEAFVSAFTSSTADGSSEVDATNG